MRLLSDIYMSSNEINQVKYTKIFQYRIRNYSKQKHILMEQRDGDVLKENTPKAKPHILQNNILDKIYLFLSIVCSFTCFSFSLLGLQ